MSDASEKAARAAAEAFARTHGMRWQVQDALTDLLLAEREKVVRDAVAILRDGYHGAFVDEAIARILALLPPAQPPQPATPAAACAHCGKPTPIECGVCVTCGRKVQPATPDRAAEGECNTCGDRGSVCARTGARFDECACPGGCMMKDCPRCGAKAR